MKDSSSKGLGLCDVLAVVFIVLKLIGVIDWSWWWVLAPIWIPVIIVVIAYIVISIVDQVPYYSRGRHGAGFTASPFFFLHTRSAQGGEIINTMQIPFWERYTLTIQEASQYFRIGETKLRKIVSENKDADFVLWNGTRPQIKRTKFERFVDQLNLI